MASSNNGADSAIFVSDDEGLPSIEHFLHELLADTIIAVGPLHTRRFAVFQPALEHVSAKLKAALTNHARIKPDLNDRSTHLLTISLSDDNPTAFGLMLAILFKRQQELKKVPPRSVILSLAELCAKYDLLHLVKTQVAKWSREYTWPKPLIEHPSPAVWVSEHERMLKASWIFEDQVMFEKALHQMHLFSILDDADELVWDMPNSTALQPPRLIDQTLLPPDYLRKTRQSQFRRLVITAREYVIRVLEESDAHCNRDKQSCKDSVVGAMARHLPSIGIPLSRPEPPAVKRKYTEDDDGLIIIAEKIVKPKSNGVDYRSISIGQLIHQLLQPEFKGTCAQRASDERACGPRSTWKERLEGALQPAKPFTLVNVERAKAGIKLAIPDFDASQADHIKAEVMGERNEPTG